MAQKITNYNVLDAAGSTTEGVEVGSALAPAPFIADPDTTVRVNGDLITSAAEQTVGGQQTVTYKINPKAGWNDGTPVTAEDFRYAWLAQNGADTTIVAASNLGYQNITSVTGATDGTVTVTFKQGPYFSDWKSLFTL